LIAEAALRLFGPLAKTRWCYDAGQLHSSVVSKVLLRHTVYGAGTEHNIDGNGGDGKKLVWGRVGMGVKGAGTGGVGLKSGPGADLQRAIAVQR